MLNKKKRIKELEGLLEVSDSKLKNAYSKISAKDDSIGILNGEITKLNAIIEEQKVIINKLKNDKSKEIKAENENKRKWLNGFHGEEYGGEKE